MKLIVVFATALATSAGAQHPAPLPPEPEPQIQDNSFLIEEAYNQPPGVVQHINAFFLDREADSWAYTFTQEWPLFSQRHQVSYTVPVERNGSPFGTGLGDVALNYRYQVPTGRDATFAVAPRLSLLLPTGEVAKARGAGGAGLQANLPVSVMIARSLVTHFNIGATYTPSTENSAGDQTPTTGFNAGQSVIWLLRPALNLMLEVAWNRTEEVVEGGKRARSDGLLLSPGIRAALNLSSGLQIVPGIAFPIGIGPSDGERSAFFYLSLEHPFAKSTK